MLNASTAGREVTTAGAEALGAGETGAATVWAVAGLGVMFVFAATGVMFCEDMLGAGVIGRTGIDYSKAIKLNVADVLPPAPARVALTMRVVNPVSLTAFMVRVPESLRPASVGLTATGSAKPIKELIFADVNAVAAVPSGKVTQPDLKTVPKYMTDPEDVALLPPAVAVRLTPRAMTLALKPIVVTTS